MNQTKNKDLMTNLPDREDKSVISHKKMMSQIRKMRVKDGFIDLRFDPIGILAVNEDIQEVQDDFWLYRAGTLYACLDGKYHCAGKIGEYCCLVAAIKGKKFISERGGGTYYYSSRKVPLACDCCMLVLFRHQGKFNLVIADGHVSNHIQMITLEESESSKKLLTASFLTRLYQHDSRLADLAQKWIACSDSSELPSHRLSS